METHCLIQWISGKSARRLGFCENPLKYWIDKYSQGTKLLLLNQIQKNMGKIVLHMNIRKLVFRVYKPFVLLLLFRYNANFYCILTCCGLPGYEKATSLNSISPLTEPTGITSPPCNDIVGFKLIY